MSIVIIRIESDIDIFARTRAAARMADAGKIGHDADYHLGFSTAEQLFSEITPSRMAIMEALKGHQPMSIYALAKMIGRNYSNVHRDCKRLLAHALIEKDGQNKVFFPWAGVEIHLATTTAARAA